TNNEQTDSLDVTVKDNQTNQSVDLGKVDPGQTNNGTINTNQQSVNDGSVTFTIVKDGDPSNSDTQNVSYTAVSCSGGPTASPTNGPTATPTDFPTSTPTSTPTPTTPASHFNTDESFKFSCDENNKVVVSGSFTNNESTDALHLTVTDNMSHLSADLGNISAGQKIDKSVNTGLQSIGAGSVILKIAKSSDESIYDTKTIDYSAFSCDNQPTATPTPTDTSGNNNCDNTDQSGNNDNNNCNQQNQNQGQDQTQNNNQNVNITINQPQVLGATTQLPSTGTPMDVWELLGGITPLGFFLRRITKK
ncbi:MAG: hypothetical protein KGJ07_09540, partial [Patescibacteria group bacterium]|nr:hypothetical protein [Patescibacteria group bacterium]